MGSISTLIYTSELVLCVHSATRHNIHDCNWSLKFLFFVNFISTVYITTCMELLTLLITYATYDTNTYTAYIAYNKIRIFPPLSILILTLLTIHQNSITCAVFNTITAETYHFTPVSDFNSIANYKTK